MTWKRLWTLRAQRLLFQTGSPWHWLGFPDGPMARLHRIASQRAFASRFGRRSWLPKLFLVMSWPVRLVFQAWQQYLQFGRMTLERHSIAFWRQWSDLIALGLGYGLPPLAYYRHRLFLRENRERLVDYLYDHEIQSLFPYLNRYCIDPAVDDKREFAERCTSAGLACVPTLAWGDGGQSRWSQEPWPVGDLISKPVSACRGEGVMLWHRSDAGYSRPHDPEPIDREELLRYLDSHCAGRAWLLQPALDNHPLIADLSPAPLLTVRLMTACDTNGHAEIFAAVLKMPVGRQQVNNHGIGSAIDLGSGLLGRAFPYRSLHAGFDDHPTTGARIVGRPLPLWDETKQLTVTAHSLFPGYFSLGWDVALTSVGPILIEVNAGWDVAMPQIALQQPLGETAFSQIVERHLRQHAW